MVILLSKSWIIWSKFGVQNKATLDQIITIKFFVLQKGGRNPYFNLFLQAEFKTNLYQIITIQNPKLGPDNNSYLPES